MAAVQEFLILTPTPLGEQGFKNRDVGILESSQFSMLQYYWMNTLVTLPKQIFTLHREEDILGREETYYHLISEESDSTHCGKPSCHLFVYILDQSQLFVYLQLLAIENQLLIYVLFKIEFLNELLSFATV